jgi:FkbM family methyltransferase
MIAIDEMNIAENVVLMKIDVEGLEKKVLEGAVELIQRERPYIVLEAWGERI